MLIPQTNSLPMTNGWHYPSPEFALNEIRELLKKRTTQEQGKSLVKGLALSLKMDHGNETPKPASVAKVLAESRPASRGLALKIGVILTTGQGFDWLSKLVPDEVDVKKDTFRQYFREDARYKRTLNRKAYLVNNRTKFLCTYAESLHIIGLPENPKQKFLEKLIGEFKLKLS